LTNWIKGLRDEMGNVSLLTSSIQLAILSSVNVITRKGRYPKQANKKLADVNDEVVEKVLDRLASGQISAFVKHLKGASDNFRLYSVECASHKSSISKWILRLVSKCLTSSQARHVFFVKLRDVCL
jgi:hypothetical protein